MRIGSRSSTGVRRRLKNGAQALLGRRGIELRRIGADPVDARRAALLESEQIDLVLDVGANAGRFASRVRESGYRGRIISFEPLRDAGAALQSNAAADPFWEVHHVALGDTDGEAEIHVAGNSFSSSLLPMGERHLESAPDSAYVGTERVRTARLDSLWAEVVADARRPWLKLDVQGYEMHVLRGLGERITDVSVIQTELAMTPLYEGDSDWRAIVDWLSDRGFSIVGVEPGFEDATTGRMLQFDGIFTRLSGPGS